MGLGRGTHVVALGHHRSYRVCPFQAAWPRLRWTHARDRRGPQFWQSFLAKDRGGHRADEDQGAEEWAPRHVGDQWYLHVKRHLGRAPLPIFAFQLRGIWISSSASCTRGLVAAANLFAEELFECFS